MVKQDRAGDPLTLYATVGLPGSGKTTWARGFVREAPDARMRVNRDDIRSMLSALPDAKMVMPDENLVTQIQNAAIRSALEKGYSVVVDNTNLRRRNLAELDRIAQEVGVLFDTVEFTDVSLALCLDRNIARPYPVPPDVIATMYEKFIKNYKPYVSTIKADKWELYTKNALLPNAYLVDIDGTIATHWNRSPYDETKVFDDHVNEDVANVIHYLWESTAQPKIVLMSGRSSNCREDTQRWLEHNSIHYDELFMRASGDQRKDSIVKHELFNTHVRDRYNVLGVFDDRRSVVTMWRAMGLTVFQVADGDF